MVRILLCDSFEMSPSLLSIQDKVTPAERRIWPTYRPGKSYEPTKFERTELSERAPDPDKCSWAHIDPYSGMLLNPTIWELEVTEDDIILTKTYANGASDAKIIDIHAVDKAHFDFTAPSVPRHLNILATIINLRPVRFLRTQPVFSVQLFLITLVVLCLIGARATKKNNAFIFAMGLFFLALILQCKFTK